LKLKFKKLSEAAVLPRKANPTDAGFDIVATEKYFDEYGNVCFKTGLAIEVPEGYVGMLFSRSSIYSKAQVLSNSVGIIDSGYLGELEFKFKILKEHVTNKTIAYMPGDRIGQLIVIPLPQFEPVFVDELDNTNDRGGGFGSSGA